MDANPFLAVIEGMVQETRLRGGSLADRLDFVRSGVSALDAGFAQTVDRMVARLQQARAGTTAPRPGEPMPGFALPDETGRLVTLEALLADGPLAVTFSRGHWCPYCRLNNQAIAEARPEFEDLGARVVTIMPERQRFAGALKADAGAWYPVLTDMDNGYALSLNLAVWVGPDMAALMAQAGCDLPQFQGNAAWLLPIPATFVVAQNGIIAARHIDPDYRHRLEIADILTAVRQAAVP
jgi:peroxiredoxin